MLAVRDRVQQLKGGLAAACGSRSVGLSVAVHLVGVFGYGGYEAWQRRHDPPDQGRSLFSFHDTQIPAHARALGRKLTGF